MINTLVISDVHLGTSVSQKEKVLQVLNLKSNTLVINGDLFDNYSFHRYDKKDWKILSKIRKLSKSRHVVLVYGNHDEDAEFLSAIAGMDLVDHYAAEIAGVKFRMEHGHNYDQWISERPFTTWFFTGIYYWIQKFDRRHRFTRRIKQLSKSWIRAKDIVRERFVQKHGAAHDVLLAGHTHYPEVRVYSNCTYANSGSFCDEKCSYIEIYDDGNFKLKYI